MQSRSSVVALAAGATLGLVVAAVLWSRLASGDVMLNSEFRIWAMWSGGFLLAVLAAAVTVLVVGRDRRGLSAFAGVFLGFALWFLWQVWVAVSSSA